ncbi:T9SS type A sorting domain-containing protein [Plebeiibacterium marinum]|uniref:Carboxypeptidase regulatory-like domain-containing protein n=1 Tax=Plebeiibacterium marinum TaxID=2992111 RepID=A0AAE3MDX9_9BACT|nr:T9SS type A sorting domain-containing protein [Plebeiobacterium marinum]MCW3806163.1 carboxypeptidase regulatory-like domain-containing protein [Plebeiobacterium marinum]
MKRYIVLFIIVTLFSSICWGQNTKIPVEFWYSTTDVKSAGIDFALGYIEKIYNDEDRQEYYQAFLEDENNTPIDLNNVHQLEISGEKIYLSLFDPVGLAQTCLKSITKYGFENIPEISRLNLLGNGNILNTGKQKLYSEVIINEEKYIASINLTISHYENNLKAGKSYIIRFDDFELTPYDIKSKNLFVTRNALLAEIGFEKDGNTIRISDYIPYANGNAPNTAHEIFNHQDSYDMISGDYSSFSIYIFDEILFSRSRPLGVLTNWTTEDLTLPEGPLELIAYNQPQSIKLTWDETDTDTFKVYRSSSIDDLKSEQNYIGSTKTSSYIDNDLTIGKKYYYTVKAVKYQNDTWRESRFSNIVGGIARLEYHFESQYNDEYLVSSNDTIHFKSRLLDNLNRPIENADVFFSDSIIHKWSSKPIQTDEDGYFDIVFRAPLIEDSYYLQLNGVKGDTYTQIPITVKTDNSQFYNIGIADCSIDKIGLHWEDDLTINTNIKNFDDKNINGGQLAYYIINLANKDTIYEDITSFSLNSNQSNTLQKIISVRASQGIYQVMVRIISPKDKNEADNIYKTEFYLSTVPKVETFKTSKYSDIDINRAVSIGGNSITPTFIGNSVAKFSINGELVTVSKNELTYIDSAPMFIEYLSCQGDTICEFSAGGKATFEVNDIETAQYAGKRFDVEISTPDNLSNDFNVFGGNEDEINNDWLPFISNGDASSNKIITFTPPSYTKEGKYQAWVQVKSTLSDESYIFRVNACIIPPNNMLRFQSVNLENTEIEYLTEPKIQGDELSLIVGIENESYFYDENLTYTYTYLISGSDSIPIGTEKVNIFSNSSVNINNPYSTLGLKIGSYSSNYLSCSGHIGNPTIKDRLPFDLLEKPQLEGEIITPAATSFALGDNISSEIRIHYQENPKSDATVVGKVISPDGKEFNINYNYDNSSETYKSTWIGNIGGWYYVEIDANRHRYKTLKLKTKYHTEVNSNFIALNSLSKVNNLDYYSFGISPVGDFCGLSTKINYDPTKKKLLGVEINSDLKETFPTFIYDDNRGEISIGLSTMNSKYGANIIDSDPIFYCSFLNLDDGSSTVSTSNCNILNHNGEVSELTNSGVQNDVDKLRVGLGFNVKNDGIQYMQKDTIYVGLNNVQNIYGASCTISISSNAQIIEVFESSLLNEANEVTTAFFSTVNDTTVSINTSRLETKYGCNNSGTIAGIVVVPLSKEDIKLEYDTVSVYGLDGSVQIETKTYNATIPVYSISGNTEIGFDADQDLYNIGDDVIVQVEVDSVIDLKAYAFDFIYDNSKFRFISANKGDFLSSEGASSSFNSFDDNGTVIIGESLLGDVKGVSTYQEKKLLCTIRLQALYFGKDTVELENVGLLSQNGSTIENVRVNDGYIEVIDAVEPFISGQVFDMFNGIINQNCYVNLFRGKDDGTYSKIEEYSISGSENRFVFQDLEIGDYKLQVVSDDNNFVNTYYQSSFMFNEGLIIEINNADERLIADINVLAKSNLETGNGIISGNIHYALTDNYPIAYAAPSIQMATASSASSGDPIEGVNILLGSSDGNTIFSSTTSNNSGFYSFMQLPEGDYSVFVDVPNIDFFKTEALSIDDTNLEVTNIDFIVDTTNFSITTGIEDNIIDQIKLYPNPTTGVVYIEKDVSGLPNIRIRVIDLTGEVIFFKNNVQYDQLQVDLSSYKDGLYFIQFLFDDRISTFKIIKSHH